MTRDFGTAEFFTGGYSVRATIDPTLQQVAAQSLRLGLEDYDRAQGVYHGTGQVIAAEQLGDWRAALSKLEVPRDIVINELWRPAVVLELMKNDARLGIEGIEGDAHILPARDVTWAKKQNSDGSTSTSAAKRVRDLLAVGDVVLVSPVVNTEDGVFENWSLRQVPKIQGGFVAMDVHTGRVLAMQGGFSYQHSVFNRATQAKRQPGSSFKPFVYAAALDSGYSPATIVIDAPIEVDTPQGLWRPKNYSDKFYGPTPVRTGIEQSRNLMTVRLAQELGMPTIAIYAEKFGVYDNMKPYLSAALGSEETTLYKMVSAYAMFANGGERVQPTLVDRVQDRSGKTVFLHDQRSCDDCRSPDLMAGLLPKITSNRERVMDPVTAYQLTMMMEGVVERGTASQTVNLPVPVAGKTGTTNDNTNGWFIGFTPDLAIGVFIGYDRPRPLGKRETGSTVAVPIFGDFLMRSQIDKPVIPFRRPNDIQVIPVHAETGERVLPKDQQAILEIFKPGQRPGGVLIDVAPGMDGQATTTGGTLATQGLY